MTSDRPETWEPRPLPEPDPESAPYWEAAANGRLLLRECADCGLIFHYPRSHCPACWAGAVDWRDAVGTGTVYSYSVAERMSGWPDAELPLIVAYVELEEGPRMMTTIVGGEPRAVSVGAAVTVSFIPTEDPAIGIPVFELAGD